MSEAETNERAMPMAWHRRQEIRLLLGLTNETVNVALARELLSEVENLTAELLERHEVMHQQRAEIERLRAALEALGRPFRGGPNLCWCPENWSGPGNHTAACLQAFDALAERRP